MNGYYGLLNIIKTSLMQNGEVKTVVTQDIDVNEIFANYKHDIFPFAQIVTSTATIDKGVTTFDVDIGLADIIDTPKKVVEDKFNGVSNEIDIYNTLYVILRRVADQLINDTYTTDLTIAGRPSLDKFLIPEHQACGWTLSFQIEVPNTISYCVDIPDVNVSCDLSYTELEGVYTINWTTENAFKVYLNGVLVQRNGSKEVFPEDKYNLYAFRDTQLCYKEIEIVR